MILMYHKVDASAVTKWWVPVDLFAEQMLSLRDRRVVYLDDYDCDDDSNVVVTFDDAYENVYDMAFPVLRDLGYPFEIFVIGDYIGQANSFDAYEPFARLASLEQLDEMVQSGARVQWHTRTHPFLDALPQTRVVDEMSVPDALAARFPTPHFAWFAYPYGAHDDGIVDLARARFRGALSCDAGSTRDRHQLNRVTVADQRCFYTTEK